MRSPTPRQWTGIVLTVVALPALTATAWPLFTFLWDLLPSGLPVGRAVLGAGLVLALAAAVALIRTQRRTSFRLWWLILAAWAVTIGAVAGMVVLIWLMLGAPGLDLPADLSPRALDAIGTRAFAVVAGLGGVALLVIHYRRQRTTEADAERAEQAATREVAKLFTDTFDSASDKLGSEHAAVRLAGVHALARLADEAPEGREDLVQMVIDVLCAYLRMPYDYAPDPIPKNASRERREEHRKCELEFAALREVRHTIIRVIGDRLRRDTRWRGKDYDFTGVVFDGGSLAEAHFTGGLVSFSGAEFTSGVVSFSWAEFAGAEVDFDGAVFTGAEVIFSGAEFGEGSVSFGGAVFAGGSVSFGGAAFTSGTVYFSRTTFSGAEVDLCGADFGEASVSFSWAAFLGGEVDFDRATGTCPIGLLEAGGASSQFVRLPKDWRGALAQPGSHG